MAVGNLLPQDVGAKEKCSPVPAGQPSISGEVRPATGGASRGYRDAGGLAPRADVRILVGAVIEQTGGRSTNYLRGAITTRL
jgi:hypothetical protein